MTFFRHFPKKFLHSQKIPHLSPKISDDLFFSHRPFSWFIWDLSIGGGQICSRHRYGGPKSLLFKKITILPLLSFLSRRGAKLHCQFRCGGHGRIYPPPWIRHCPSIIDLSSTLQKQCL